MFVEQLNVTEKCTAWIVPVLSIYPVHFFYNFLYYTDTLSTVSLVLTYWVASEYLLNTNGPITKLAILAVSETTLIQ
jgi:hypothetical protein